MRNLPQNYINCVPDVFGAADTAFVSSELLFMCMNTLQVYAGFGFSSVWDYNKLILTH